MSNAPRGAHPVRMLLQTGAAVLGLGAATLVAQAVATTAAAVPDHSSGTYIVILAQAPAASYRGGTGELARTAPRANATYDASSPAARRYTRFLVRSQDRVAAAVGARPLYHYTTSLNGFAAPLTEAQVRSLSGRDGVLAVVPDQVRRLQDRPGSTRVEQAGPSRTRTPTAGRPGPTGSGVVIGVVDSGIDSDSRSLAPTGGPVPTTYTGQCVAGVDPDRAAEFGCSDKVVGGGYYAQGQGGGRAVWNGEYLSPEDYLGHGTRTASAAAGAATQSAEAGVVDLGRFAGTAPGAAVASYKVCWAAEDGTSSCLTSDALAGIDQAVADGIDVLSYGVGGTTADVADPVELAFLHAADAGVFVATAAGNGGPRPGSTAHPSPWTTTVGATAQDAHSAVVVLGNGERHAGTSVTPDDVAEAPLVLGRDAAVETADESDAQLCFPGSLDPAAVAGTLVVCDRGTNDRVEKSAVVEAAGGVGMLLLNTTAGGSLDPDLHALPSVHLPASSHDDVNAYIESTDRATASIRAGAGQSSSPPGVAEFSGRGPTRAAGGDLLKPDLVAPGVGVLTAVADGGLSGHHGGFDLSSGTSVAAARVAGLAARLVQAHPGWSPMAVKSALMTTAGGAGGTGRPFQQGAGLVRPVRSLDPGLVLDAGRTDWASYLAGQGRRYVPGSPPVRASNLNAAAVVISRLTGRETVRRTVTNVDDDRATYSVSAPGVDGISITAVPSVFTLDPGERQTISLRIVRDDAALGAYETGFLALNDGSAGHVVRLPVAIRPVGIQAPRQVRIDGNAVELTTESGIRGTLTTRVRGLVAGLDTVATGSDTHGADFDPGMPGLWSQTLDLAGPREWLRIQTLADDPHDDLDLFLLGESGQVVASTSTARASETLTVHGLPKGAYRVAVQPAFVADPSGDTTFTVRTFTVAPRSTGTLSVEPRRQGASPSRRNTWSLATGHLEPGAAWFGWIGWYAGDERVGRTLVVGD